MDHIVVPTKDDDGNDINLMLVAPDANQIKEAQLVSGKAFQEAVQRKLIFREKLNDYLREQGIWDDKKEAELKEVSAKLLDGERRLAKGGAGGFTKAQAKKLALDMRRWRVRQAEILAKTRELDEYTVQAYCENARFDYLVSVCTKYDDNRDVFKSLDDYREKSSKRYAVDAASNLAKLLHNFDDNWEKKLPENAFLIKYKFVNDDLALVNEDNKLVDENGRLINEEGRYINELGEYVDVNGNKVDADGKPIEEFEEFKE